MVFHPVYHINFLIFPFSSIIFLPFFLIFFAKFCPPGGQLAHPGRPCLLWPAFFVRRSANLRKRHAPYIFFLPWFFSSFKFTLFPFYSFSAKLSHSPPSQILPSLLPSLKSLPHFSQITWCDVTAHGRPFNFSRFDFCFFAPKSCFRQAILLPSANILVLMCPGMTGPENYCNISCCGTEMKTCHCIILLSWLYYWYWHVFCWVLTQTTLVENTLRLNAE